MRLPWLDELLCRGPVRSEVELKAAALLAVDERTAYDVARKEGRRLRGDARQARFWSRVAREIAKREGREIGVTGADRYLGPP